jgi:hypothetical protein
VLLSLCAINAIGMITFEVIIKLKMERLLVYFSPMQILMLCTSLHMILVILFIKLNAKHRITLLQVEKFELFYLLNFFKLERVLAVKEAEI